MLRPGDWLNLRFQSVKVILLVLVQPLLMQVLGKTGTIRRCGICDGC